jgi:hypothetical protein
MAKIKVNKKQATEKVLATENKVAVKTVAKVETHKVSTPVAAKATTTPAPAVKANQPIPEGVHLMQPPSGETVNVGETKQVGRRRYGGNYFGELSPINYALACKFMAACLKAVKNAEGLVTPEKLCLNVPNVHGTPDRVFAIENNGSSGLAFHSRYFTQEMFDLCHKAGVTVFGNMEKGTTVGGKPVTVPRKAHSNSVKLTPETLGLCVELAVAKAATL